MNPILVQVIGGIGYSILAFSYFRKEKKDILFMQIFSYLFFTTHYYLLNGITGAVCNILGLVAFIIIYLFDKYDVKNKNLLTICIIPFVVVIAFLTFDNVYSIFPIIASVVAILSFLTDSESIIRAIGIVAAICWLIYAVVYDSYVSIVFEVITLIFVAIAFIKNEVLKRKNK